MAASASAAVSAWRGERMTAAIEAALQSVRAGDNEPLEGLYRALLERLDGLLSQIDQPCKAVLSVPLRMSPEEADKAGELVSKWLEAPRAALTIPADCHIQLYNALGVSLRVEVRREDAVEREDVTLTVDVPENGICVGQGAVAVEVVEIQKPVTAHITYEGAA